MAQHKDKPVNTARFEIYPERKSIKSGFGGVIKTGKERRYRWRLIAANNEIVAHSEGYVNKRDCEKTVSAMKRIVNEALEKVYYLGDLKPSRNTMKWVNPLRSTAIIDSTVEDRYNPGLEKLPKRAFDCMKNFPTKKD